MSEQAGPSAASNECQRTGDLGAAFNRFGQIPIVPPPHEFKVAAGEACGFFLLVWWCWMIHDFRNDKCIRCGRFTANDKETFAEW